MKKRNLQKFREDHVKLRVYGRRRVAEIHSQCVSPPTLHRRGYYILDPDTGKTLVPLQSVHQSKDSHTHKLRSLIPIQYLDVRHVLENWK